MPYFIEINKGVIFPHPNKIITCSFEFNKREVSNFSKKNMLLDMIYNKYYMSIKNKSKKGEFFMPKNFII